MSAPPTKTTFTLTEAADLLSCHRETLRRAIRDGELKAAKLGVRDFRISRRELASFWGARGGGELFAAEEAADEEIRENEARREREAVKAVDKKRQIQLTLPGAGEK
ncbi:MAG: helix-turn-helix domain-containing protein [Desulfovibrio sp.]|jgi:excisionase family DNA binding protein|nr:helix-turn-helix domain-containing protein [Desulfovibrio sp.]